MKAIKILSGLIFVLAVFAAVYIVINHMGITDGLDFGAGAYYYADIPDFERFVDGDAYTSQVSSWVIIGLFLLWGAVVYKLWTWIK